ncbi:hypothetical protein [Liquorilactobacillus hordei]|uniref:Uncharacterized protein n=1 Tax=Liquorilactobacillus hordei DSM 19519 TaxID=1423759 RepID=A0A0R1MJ49_9LACO|nr:hypothetical protein [Liquorilactobacillus hordei]KRL07983.1 hypothetical protein FC92_GL001052 [Liquorilactobacillus hordei DSM 19519]QYH51073.1 hypothetical protein G6O70_00495 [Liquorilactobacillus hordei DSM 19519]
MSELSLEEKLAFLQRRVELYQKMSNGRYHLYVNDDDAEDSGVFMDQAKSGLTANQWSFIPCTSLLFRVDERYEDIVKGGGSFKKALVGGLLFGTTGAIVGGAGRGTQSSNLTTLNINCYINGQVRLVPEMSIKLVNHPIDTRTLEYQRIKDWLSQFTTIAQSHGAVYGGEERKNI